MANEAKQVMDSAKMDALVAAVKRAMPDEVRKADLLAEVRKVHYDASIRKGFTADQAILLCMDTNFS